MTPDYAGVAAVIGAILTPLSVVILAWLGSRRLQAVGDTATETLRQTALVNHAVNGKDPRQSTLSEDVITIRDKQEADVPSLVAFDKQDVALIPLVKTLISRVESLEQAVRDA